MNGYPKMDGWYIIIIIIIIIIINLTLWHTLQIVIHTQKCVPNQKNQLWSSVSSSV